MADPLEDTSAAVAAYLNPVQNNPAQAARVSVSTALDANPDFEADLRKAAQRTGVPLDSARSYPEDVKRQATLAAHDFDEMAKEFPNTAKFLANTDNARIAHDDIDNMSMFEQTLGFIKNTGKALGSSGPQFNASMWGLAQAATETFIQPITGALAGKILPEDIGGKMAGQFGQYRREQEGVAKGLMPKTDGVLESGYYSGVQSLGQNLLTLPAAIMTGQPQLALSSMAASTGGGAYGQARDKGVSVPGALVFGTSQAAIEYATEKLPMQLLLKDLKVGTPFYKTLVHQMASEVPGEQIATVLQDANEWAVLNPELPISAYLAERPSAAAQTLVATIVATGGQVSTVKGLQMAGDRITGRAREAQFAEQNAQALMQLNDLAAASKLRARDPDSFQAFVAQAMEDGPVQDVYINAATFAQSLTDAGIPATEIAAISPAIAEQLQEAILTGGDIRIPVEEFAARIAGTDYAQSLLPHLKTDPTGMTQAEAATFMQGQAQELQSEVERTLAAKEQDDTFKASRDQVTATMLEQLKTAGRFTDEVNTAYASMTGSFYSVMAARLGITPTEMMQRYPLQVAVERLVGAKTLDQPAYHGTPHRFDKFTLDKIGTGEGAQAYGWGLYFAGNKDIAEHYRKTLSGPQHDYWFDGKKVDAPQGGWKAAGAKFSPEAYAVLKIERHGSAQAALDALDGNLPTGVDVVDQGAEILRRATEDPAYMRRDRSANPGQLYEVNIPDDGQYLLWDKPMSEQPEQIKAAVENIRQMLEKADVLDEYLDRLNAEWDEVTGAELVKKLLPRAARDDVLPYEVPGVDGALENGNPDEAVSRYLHSLGMAGIKYLDGGSRTAGEGNHNYVLFDDKSVEIAKTFYQPKGWDSIDPGRTDVPPVKGGNTRGQISFGRDITQQPTVISLFNNADLSTFLHESGHFFLEVMHDIASRPDAPDTVKQDMGAVLKWFGITGVSRGENADQYEAIQARLTELERDGKLDGDEWNVAVSEARALRDKGGTESGTSPLDIWNGYDLEQKRLYHEQFARGFESYLFEGKSPSIELQGLFQRFRAWMLNVYRELRALNVTLTDEVRGVFDRMLASNEAIVEAEQARNYGGLFETKPDFLTDAEWLAYQNLGNESTQEAVHQLESRSLRDMQWLSNAKSKLLSKLQADAREKRKAVRREVEAEVMAEPINQARTFLKRGEATVDGEKVQVAAGHKIDIAAVREMYPESGLNLPDWQKLGYGQYGMLAKDGLHPDLAAEMFGFTSGDQLVRELLDGENPRDKIEGITDQRMLERHGDLTDPVSIAKAADAALHNDARIRFVATELNALNKAVGARPVLAKAAKAFAEAAIARQKVRNLRPSQYAAASARAAKAADKAFKAGDVEAAATEKRNQLVNSYADRAAHAAQDEVQKAIDYFNKFNREGSRSSLDVDYLDQIDALLARFDLRKGQSLKAIDKRKSLATWIESQREQGLEPDVPPELVNEAFRKSYRDMTVEELRGLRDTVKQIEHLGRLKNKLLTAQDQRTFDEVRERITAGIEEHAGDRTADTRTPTTNMGRAVQGLKRFWAAHIKAATWARVLDGGKDGGPMWEYFIRSANVAGDNETQMRADATKALSEILAPVFKLGKMGGKGVFFPTIGKSLNRESRITIALNVGNESNLQRLLGGEGWTPTQLQPVLDSLTKPEWDAVQAVWNHFESYRPQIGAKERRIYGKEPEWVDPAPVVTPHGEYRGGYYPIKYDPAASQRAEEHADAEGAKRQLQGAYTSATTRRSFTKARAEEVTGRPLLYSLAGLYSGVNDVIHDLSWHEWLIDVNRLLRSKSIDNAIRSHYGPEVKAQFKSWTADVAEGEKAADNAGEVALGKLRQNVSVAGLGYNVMSATMQGLGITQSIVRVGPTYFARGVAQYLAHPLDAVKSVNEKSDFMASRSRTRYRELNELRNKVQGETTDRVKVYAYVLMMRAQQVVDTPTWLGAYEKAIGSGETENRAAALADQAVIDAQGGGQTKDLSAIERGGNAMKLFTVFYSFMNTALNLGVAQTMTAKSRAKLASDYLLLFSIPPVLGALLKDALTPGDGGDDDDWSKLALKLLGEQIGYLMGLMVVGREFGEAAKTIAGTADRPRDYAGPAGVRLIADAGSFAKQAVQGEFDDAFRKAAVNLVGDLTGLPSAQINRTVTGSQALAEGKTENPAAIVFGFQQKK